MSQDKYIGMDVHQASVSVAVLDGGGKLTMECVLETKASTIVEFIRGVRGSLAVTFEEMPDGRISQVRFEALASRP
jgi:hypothetical protein